jgi:20S proteasome subunit beta 5
MNTFADRFSSTSATSHLKKGWTLAADDEEFSDAVWGSEAGFGSLAKGVPSFTVPAVSDVSCALTFLHHRV